MYEDVNFDDLFNAPPPEKNNMASKLKDLLPRFEGRTFTVAIVLTAVRRVGIEAGSRASISGVLNKLEKEGFIELVRKGKGSAPHHYKATKKNDN